MTAQELLEAMQKDSELAKAMRTAESAETFLAKAKEMGYDVTQEALKELNERIKGKELDLGDLDFVAGGIIIL